MVIDMVDVRNALVFKLGDEVSSIINSDNFIGELGGAITTLGVILLLGHYVKRWIKRKGYRMVLKDRNDKMHALLLRINQDGLDDAVERGEISSQEEMKLFAELASKLGLRDLVPKKRIARLVKAEIKARRANASKSPPKIPGEKPPRPVARLVKAEVKLSPLARVLKRVRA